MIDEIGIKFDESKGFYYIIFAKFYQPFDKFPIDSYYLASNQLYLFARELVDNGAACRYKGNYKKLAIETGLAHCVGKNTLSYGKNGSRVVYEALEVSADGLETVSKFLMSNNLVAAEQVVEKDSHGVLSQSGAPISHTCTHCKLCENACPTHAIGEKFSPELCLRSHMDKGEFSEEIGRLMGDKIFGCDICQRVCPMNSAVDVVPPTEDLRELVDGLPSNFLMFAPLIGKNLARDKIIGHMARNAINNRPKKP